MYCHVDMLRLWLKLTGRPIWQSNFIFQAGALLACGIVNSGVRNECDPALALLSDYVSHNTSMMRIGAIVG